MNKLVPCKSCKKEIAKSAKTCPGCGVKDPGTTPTDIAKGCLGFIMFAIVFGVLMNSCGDDENPEPVKVEQPAKVKVNNAPIINDANFDDLVIEMNDYYISSVTDLFQHYAMYKDKERHVFINWRNKEWSPVYDNKREYYDDVIAKNRDYITSQSANSFFIAIPELYQLSLDVMYAVKDQDISKLQLARDRFKKEAGMMNEYLKSRGLESRIK